MRLRDLLLPAALIGLLAGCNPPQAAAPAAATQPVAQALGDAQESAHDAIADPVDDAQRSVAEATTAAVVAAQGVVQEALPPQPPAEAPALPAAATRLIVRWEVTSPAYYTKRLQHPVWPGGASGVTIGVGYDLGQATAPTIAGDWAAHPQADRLPAAAGVSGADARALARQMRDVATPYPLAEQVFTASTLPRYHAAARRALGPGFDALPDNPQGALDSLGYNRGWSMIGPNRREMREIRDTCIPTGDAACIAAQLRSMKRLWPGDRAPGPGLRARRDDEAAMAERDA